MKLVNLANNAQLTIGAGNANRAYVVWSYGTPVLAIDCSGQTPRMVRLWDGWSATTQRHINKALDYIGKPHVIINKAAWEKMEVEEP